MSILIITKAVYITNSILPLNQSNNSALIAIIFNIDIFSPSGELVSLQSLRCSLLAVVHYSFVGHGLAFAAI